MIFFHLEFVDLPQSINITLGEVAVMNCTAVATLIHWEINGYSVIDYNDKGFHDSPTEDIFDGIIQNLRTKKLWVTGSSDSDGAQVVCVATLAVNDGFQSVVSKPAIVLVQGII